jgi:hypothetical protein
MNNTWDTMTDYEHDAMRDAGLDMGGRYTDWRGEVTSFLVTSHRYVRGLDGDYNERCCFCTQPEKNHVTP